MKDFREKLRGMPQKAADKAKKIRGKFQSTSPVAPETADQLLTDLNAEIRAYSDMIDNALSFDSLAASDPALLQLQHDKNLILASLPQPDASADQQQFEQARDNVATIYLQVAERLASMAPDIKARIGAATQALAGIAILVKDSLEKLERMGAYASSDASFAVQVGALEEVLGQLYSNAQTVFKSAKLSDINAFCEVSTASVNVPMEAIALNVKFKNDYIKSQLQGFSEDIAQLEAFAKPTISVPDESIDRIAEPRGYDAPMVTEQLRTSLSKLQSIAFSEAFIADAEFFSGLAAIELKFQPIKTAIREQSSKVAQMRGMIQFMTEAADKYKIYEKSADYRHLSAEYQGVSDKKESLERDLNEYLKLQTTPSNFEALLEEHKKESKSLKALSPEADIVLGMIAQIKKEYESISQLPETDPRADILKDIGGALSQTLDAYIAGDENKKSFVGGVLGVIRTAVSKEILSQLSLVKNPFIQFIRLLLEPINKLIALVKDEVYRPKFFASSTEKTISGAAQKAHRELQEIKRVVDSETAPSVRSRGPGQSSE